MRISQPARPRKLAPQITHERIDVDGKEVLFSYHRLVPNQDAYSFEAPVATNSIGIRNQEVVVPKPDGIYRIVALGDSHTFGYAVEDKQTWPRQLEQQLRRADGSVEVINAGIAGLSIEQEVQFLKHQLMDLHPDLVVMAYYWNDMPIQGDPNAIWSADESLIPQSATKVSKSTDTVKSRKKENSGSVVKSLFRESYLIYGIVQRIPYLQMKLSPSHETAWKQSTLEGKSTPKIDAAWAFSQSQIEELRDLGKQNDVPVMMVAVPLFEQMVAKGFATSEYQDRLKNICGKNEILFVDPLESILKINPSYPECFIPFDGHPNGKIYAVIADKVAKAVTKLRSEQN